MSKINIDKISSREGKNINISGSLVATTGSFTGNVSVANTLTYEDITNINSTGVVTARTGIDVTAGGIDAVGVVTATSFSGSGSNLTNIESGLVKLTASGTIPNGASVIMNTDGTVGVVTGTITDQLELGVIAKAEDAVVVADRIKSVYDPINNKVIVAYDSTSLGRLVVGTVTGNTIGFGTVITFNSADTPHIALEYDVAHEKVILAYANGTLGQVLVCSVVGDSITFGDPTTFKSVTTQHIDLSYDSDNETVIFSYYASSKGQCRVGRTNGYSMQFGDEVIFNNQTTTDTIANTYDPDTKQVVLSYRDAGTKGNSIVGVATGTLISFPGSEVTFNSVDTDEITSVYDTVNQKVVVMYRDQGGSDYGAARVATVGSGATISFGAESFFNASNTVEYNSSVYDPGSGKIVVAFQDDSNSSYGAVVTGTVSGTDISFSGKTIYKSAAIHWSDVTYDSNARRAVIVYEETGTFAGPYGIPVSSTTRTTNLTDTGNFIGIAATSISDTQTGEIQKT